MHFVYRLRGGKEVGREGGREGRREGGREGRKEKTKDEQVLIYLESIYMYYTCVCTNTRHKIDFSWVPSCQGS